MCKSPFSPKNIDSCEQLLLNLKYASQSVSNLLNHDITSYQSVSDNFFFVNKDKRILILRMYTNFIIFTQ